MENEIIKIDKDNYSLPETLKSISDFEREIEVLKKQEKEMKETLLKCMEESGTLKLKNEDLTISFVGETFKDTFDTKAFKEKYPELYKQFTKTSITSSSVRFTLAKK